MYFDRFDICEAYWLYMCLYHSGQASKLYRLTGVFAKLQFEPRSDLDEDSLSENGRMIYDRLVSGKIEVRDRRY